jgi:hypothetical protein
MAHSYTPGLKVLHETRVIKERRLPLKGKVIVKQGDRVSPSDVVATTDLPGNVQMVNVANLLNIDQSDVMSVMLKRSGEAVAKDEVIAETKGLFGLFKSNAKSPVDGTIESISTVTGQVVVREKPVPVEIDAYITGLVEAIIPDEGVEIVTEGVFIQGIFGIGGEHRGTLRLVVNNPDDEITADLITGDLKGDILVGGSFISLEAYEKAVKTGVAGIVVGGFDYRNLEKILGYALGVAITGSEDIGTSLIITEGFGKIQMSARIFDLLTRHNGKFASINGATQIRAGVIRPEIIIALRENEMAHDRVEMGTSEGISAGSLVRVIRAPYFGRIGTVQSLPSKLHKMESESMVRIAEVQIDGKLYLIPRSNLEMIETD